MAQQRQQTVNKSFRIPLIGTQQNRTNSGDKDQRFINCFPESRKNDITDTKKIYLVKRPGMSVNATLSAGEGRGVYYWKGSLYTVIGTTLYKNATSIKTLTTSTGHVGFTEATSLSGDVLFVADGTLCYTVNASGTVTTVPVTYSQWASTTAYADAVLRIPTTANGYYYEVIIAGTSGGSEPTWPTYIGGQVSDGTVVWKCSGYYGFAYGAWPSTSAVALGRRIVPSVANTFYYECVTAGTTAGTEPVWPQTRGATITDGTVTWQCIDTVDTTTPMPKDHLPYPVFLDGSIYLIAKDSSGNATASIYNSEIDNPYSWNQVNFLDAEMYPDNLVALARQNNSIVALGDSSIEFFYDAAQPVGSPLLRNESLALQIGCAAASSIADQEKFLIFVAQSNTGGKAVWLLDGFSPKKVSDEYIERILDGEGSSISTSTGYLIRTAGHPFYVLNLTSQGRTLVYDLEEKMWHEWSTNSSGSHTVFNGKYATDGGAGAPLVLGRTDGKVYSLSQTVGTDNTTSILMQIITTKYDFESMNRKTMLSLNVVGDSIASNTLDVRWSDDDYVTWSNTKTINVTPRAYFTRLGMFRRRAFDIKYTGTSPYRIEALEFEVTLGNS